MKLNKKNIPSWALNAASYFIDIDKRRKTQWLANNPYIGTEYENSFNFNSEYCIGIIKDIAHEHQNYISACVELKISYKVIDLHKNNWIEEVNNSKCDMFMIWPTIFTPIHKQFWDERLYFLTSILKKQIFPSHQELWLYESKRRTRDWLLFNNLPHPKTDIFFDKDEAINFVNHITFPIVLKTDQGAGSKGVYILKSKEEALQKIQLAFKAGISLKRTSRYERHKGYIIFQEYLNECKEWRLIRVGNDFFCRYKIKSGEFHSGSGSIVWAKPPEHLLNSIKEISDKHHFRSINIDYFETTDGRFLINELHALFGGRVLNDEELNGKYNFINNKWEFIKGDFFRNRCANIRINYAIENLIKI
jgi:glutathione synthase/RimK-type ligase-like ATP-grasp enzyme